MAVPDRVLVVDDEEGMRDSCERVLTKDGFEVFTSADGVSASKLLNKWVFDLIILDLFITGRRSGEFKGNQSGRS